MAGMATTHHHHRSSGYTDEFENLLRSWAERAGAYIWLHYEASNYYFRLKNMIGIPTIILSTIAGAAVFSTNSTPTRGWLITIGALNITVTILSTLNTFLGFEKLWEQHRNISKEFSNYYRNIKTELSFASKDRKDPIVFLNQIQAEFKELTMRAPHIPDKVMRNFMEKFKDNKSSKPIIVSAMDQVFIHESPNSSQVGSDNDRIRSVINRVRGEFDEGLSVCSNTAIVLNVPPNTNTMINTFPIHSQPSRVSLDLPRDPSGGPSREIQILDSIDQQLAYTDDTSSSDADTSTHDNAIDYANIVTMSDVGDANDNEDIV